MDEEPLENNEPEVLTPDQNEPNEDGAVAALEVEAPAPTSPEQEIDDIQPDIGDLFAMQADSDGYNSDSSDNSDSTADPPEDSADSDEIVPRWTIPQSRVNDIVDMLVSPPLPRRGGVAGLINRDNFLQRVRGMIFSQERQRSMAVETESEADGQIDEPPPPMDIDLEGGVRFDTNLPAEHSYFGTNLHRVPGVNYLEVGSTHKMLVFLHQHILFPGEVLPFMTSGNCIDEEVQDSGCDGTIFAIGFPRVNPTATNARVYGVTCQIYERGEGDRQMMSYKSRALQRVIINLQDLEGKPEYIARNPSTKCYGKVKILPEYYLPEPLSCIDMGSMNRFRDIPSMRDKFLHFQMATTPWPTDACQEYCYNDIVEKARKKLEKHKIDTMPKCPIQLSFWLVRNLPLNEKMIRQAFLTDSVNTRLQLIGSTLKEDVGAYQESLFYCRYCNSSLAYCSDLFAMSKHGVQTQYCNSAGYIHETNTVYRVMSQSIGYTGEPSTEFSWFPGYQWHIILCKFCAQHVGWEFKAVEANLAPKVFFGLAGSSVRIGKTSETAPVRRNPYVVRNLLNLIGNEME